MTPILSVTLAPRARRRTAAPGRRAPPSARGPRARAAARRSRAADGRRPRVAWARCAAPNASSTYTSASRASAAASSGSLRRLARLEAAVLEHQQLSRPEAPGLRLDIGADHRRRHAHLGAEQLGQTSRHRRHRERRVRTVLRPAEVRDQHGGAAPVADQLDRRQGRADAGVVGHCGPAVTVRQRHVEVDSGEHPRVTDRGVANARLVEGPRSLKRRPARARAPWRRARRSGSSSPTRCRTRRRP